MRAYTASDERAIRAQSVYTAGQDVCSWARTLGSSSRGRVWVPSLRNEFSGTKNFLASIGEPRRAAVSARAIELKLLPSFTSAQYMSEPLPPTRLIFF